MLWISSFLAKPSRRPYFAPRTETFLLAIDPPSVTIHGRLIAEAHHFTAFAYLPRVECRLARI
jgi:hypothetical protein